MNTSLPALPANYRKPVGDAPDMLASAATRWLRPGSFRLFSPKAMRLMSRLRGRVDADS